MCECVCVYVYVYVYVFVCVCVLVQPFWSYSRNRDLPKFWPENDDLAEKFNS